jgi:hypothetical protein
MMGRQTVDQSQLFYLFNLEMRIPERHGFAVCSWHWLSDERILPFQRRRSSPRQALSPDYSLRPWWSLRLCHGNVRRRRLAR